MTAFAGFTRRFEGPGYSIEFQKSAHEGILDLYSQQDGTKKTYVIEEISEEIIRQRLDRGNTPSIQQGRVCWINELGQISGSNPISSNSERVQSLSSQILRRDPENIQEVEGFQKISSVFQTSNVEKDCCLDEDWNLTLTVAPPSSMERQCPGRCCESRGK